MFLFYMFKVCRGKQTVTIEDRDKLRYVESTIKEVLRIAKPGEILTILQFATVFICS